jgi:signal transduction histidine kinase
MPRVDEQLEFWERHEVSFFRALPYPLLFLCAVFDVALRHGIGTQAAIDLGVVTISAALLGLSDWRDRRESWLDTQVTLASWLAAPLFLVLVGLSAVLVIRQPLYGFYSWTGYIWSWRLLRGNWRFGGVALVALVTATSQTGSGPYRSTSAIVALVAVYLVNLTISSGFTWFGWIGNEQQRRRADRVSALAEANARLEATLRDNAELHDQLLSQARAAAVVDERRRMAREIHDTLAQGLTGIVTQLQAAQSIDARLRSDSPGARHIESAIDLARESLTEARRSVHALTPEALEGARLPDAVGEIASRWTDLQGVPVAFTTTGAARAMRPEVEVALLRTAQEALANVAKHAQASRVGLTLSYMEDLVTLDVRDDGVGFKTPDGAQPKPRPRAGGGFGLDAMRERVEGVGGRLAIETEPGGGTAISAAIPAMALVEQP